MATLSIICLYLQKSRIFFYDVFPFFFNWRFALKTTKCILKNPETYYSVLGDHKSSTFLSQTLFSFQNFPFMPINNDNDAISVSLDVFCQFLFGNSSQPWSIEHCFVWSKQDNKELNGHTNPGTIHSQQEAKWRPSHRITISLCYAGTLDMKC